MGAFGAGFLQAFGDAQKKDNLLRLQENVKQRDHIQEVLEKLTLDPSIRPEAQQEYGRQLQVLHSTPYDKKLPKDVGNLSIKIQPQAGGSLSQPPGPQPPSSGSMTGTSQLPDVPKPEPSFHPAPIATGGPGTEQGPTMVPDLPPPPSISQTQTIQTPPSDVPLPKPPSSVGPQFSPEELGQRTAAQNAPILEAKRKSDLQTKMDEYNAQTEGEINRAKKFGRLSSEDKTGFLTSLGKTAPIPKRTNVLLNDGTTTDAIVVTNPGELPKFYDPQGNEVTNSVKQELGKSNPKGPEIIRGADGIPVGVKTPDGKEWFGTEKDIPKEVGVLLSKAQEASDKAFGRKETIQANAQAAAMDRLIKGGAIRDQSALNTDARKASGDALKAVTSYTRAQELAKQGEAGSARADLALVFEAVRSMVAGAGRMTNVEIEKELKAGNVPDRIARAYSIAVHGTLPPSQRAEILGVIKTDVDAKKQHAGELWDNNMRDISGKSVARPPHLKEGVGELTPPSSTNKDNSGVVKWGRDAQGNPVQLP